MKDKKLLVLGASYSQIPLFRAAGRLGIETYAVTVPGPYQGISHADHVIYADITKPEEVWDAVLGLGADAVTTGCMDVGTRTLGYLCDRMSLPGPGLCATEGARDKSLQKKKYEESGIPTAAYAIVHDVRELEEAMKRIGFPLMIKAVDLMGSRGIFRADDENQARQMFEESMAQTKKSYCIAEQFLEGEMFGVEGIMNADGSIAYYLALGNDLHDGNPPFPQGHYVPWEKEDELSGKIGDMVLRTAAALDFRSCAFDMDCMLVGEECYVIEATPRCGATGIADTVSLFYGIDYFEAIIRCALGEDVGWMFRAKQEGKTTPNASWLLSAPSDGVIASIRTPEILPECVTDLSFNVRPGDRVRRMQNGRDRIGQLIVKGSGPEDCHRTIQQVLGMIAIDVHPETEETGG